MHFTRIMCIILLVGFLLAGCSGNQWTGTAPGWMLGWDSTLLQTQVGTNNSNKAKIVMRIWFEYNTVLRNDGDYDWKVSYFVYAEDHNKYGQGWHKVKQLRSLTVDATVLLPSGYLILQQAPDVDGLKYYSAEQPHHSKTLPVFVSVTMTGTRWVGDSTLSLTWP